MSLAGPQYTADPEERSTTRSKSWKMSDRGWCTERRTRRFPRARRNRVMTRLWAVKLSRPEVGSSRIRMPRTNKKNWNVWMLRLGQIAGTNGVCVIRNPRKGFSAIAKKEKNCYLKQLFRL